MFSVPHWAKGNGRICSYGASARIHPSLHLSCFSWIGDKWKIAFSATSGYYEYMVIHGLSCTPLAYQCFINDVLRDMLEKFMVTYTDDILIYSPSMEIHVTHSKRCCCVFWRTSFISKVKYLSSTSSLSPSWDTSLIRKAKSWIILRWKLWLSSPF